jgi:putative DNA-invertase from lambdoid prophage Rac
VAVEEGVSGSIPVAERPAAGPLFAKLTKGDAVIAPKLEPCGGTFASCPDF